MAKKKTTRKGATKRPSQAAPKKAAAQPKTPKQTATPGVGALLTRKFKGATHTVQRTADGWLYKSKPHRSLTAIAREITGYAAVSGPRWFGIDQKGGGE